MIMFVMFLNHIVFAEGLDPSLFPIRLPQSIENDGDLFDLHLALLNDYYKEALKYLRLALSSGAYDKEVLHAYIQVHICLKKNYTCSLLYCRMCKK